MGRKIRVVIVEDEIIVARDVQNRLEVLGYDVVGSAATADDAIALTIEHEPDLVLMDIMLRGDKDGIYAAEVIRSSLNIPIIFLTANSDSSTIDRAKHTDAYGYLLKPFGDRELLTTIEMSLYKFEMNSQLESNRHWFVSMFNSIGDAVVAIDNNDQVSFLNPMARQMLGVTDDDIMGQTISTYIKLFSKGKQQDLKLLAQDICVENRTELISDLILQTYNGEQIPVDLSARFIVDELEKEMGAVFVFRDISERKCAEEEIREANRKLEEQAAGLRKTNERMSSLFKKLEEQNSELQKLDHLKSEFISTVSHELRTPLTIIREGVSLVKDEVLGSVNESQADMLKDIIDSSDRLAKIINDLLDISKLESGKLDLYRKETDTCALVSKVVKDFAIKAKHHDIELISAFDESINNVYVDADRILQVFNNLISNAIKFTPAHGKVMVKVSNSVDYVSIAVSDTGKGIASGDLKKLFDKFSQFGRTAGPGEKGTGLGLSIAKSLVEMHEGKISVESELGKGTTFICQLPRYLNPEDRAIRIFKREAELLSRDDNETNCLISVIFFRLNNLPDMMLNENEEHFESFMYKINQMLQKNLYKDSDVCLALGNGEFVIFLPETNYAGACAVANKLKIKLLSEDVCSSLLYSEPDLSVGAFEADVKQVDAENILNLARGILTQKKKILIVDDHPQVVRLLSYRLDKEERFECHGVFSGVDAMNYLEEEIPNLIILDIMMPEMSGYEVVGRLKEDQRFRDIPIVLLTAMTVDTQDEKSPLPGSIPVVSKTEGFKNLMQIIDSL